MRASARVADDIVHMVARGLGADLVDLRIGYASLAITVGNTSKIPGMKKITFGNSDSLS